MVYRANLLRNFTFLSCSMQRQLLWRSIAPGTQSSRRARTLAQTQKLRQALRLQLKPHVRPSQGTQKTGRGLIRQSARSKPHTGHFSMMWGWWKGGQEARCHESHTKWPQGAIQGHSQHVGGEVQLLPYVHPFVAPLRMFETATNLMAPTQG